MYGGTFETKKAGTYKFKLSSDDGSSLWIDGKQVIDNDGVHGVSEVEGEVELTAGRHAMKVWYFQGPATEIALQLFITRTKLGWAMQAVAQNRALASVLGINVSRLVTITFVLNAALTAIAAILIAPVYLVKYDIGVGLGLKAFYAAIGSIEEKPATKKPSGE